MAFLEEIKKKVPEPDEILLEGGVWGPGAEEVMMENKGQAKDLALAQLQVSEGWSVGRVRLYRSRSESGWDCRRNHVHSP